MRAMPVLSLPLAVAKIQEGGVDLLSPAIEPGRSAAFLVLLSFLVTWVFIRTSARLMRSPKVTWWPGSVTTDSGLHVHHMVFGIILMMLAGFTAFATNLGSPWWEITAIAFGIGIGLTLDEFALWLHLEDVYWSEEGRSSIDAVVIAVLFAGLIVIGVRPLDVDSSGGLAITIGSAVLVIVLAGITFMKGRLFLGVVAFFLPFIGLYCVCRLAKPDSMWAKLHYKDSTEHGRHKMERAIKRWPPDRRAKRMGRKFQDAVGGTPTAELAPEEPPVT